MLKGDCVMLPEIFKNKLVGVNSTTILTGMGVTGVVTTAYLTGRASFKAAQIIDRETQRRVATAMTPDKTEPEMTPKEKLKLVWPLYVAPISLGTTTITAIVMSNHAASKKIAALTVASGISERAFQEYKAKVVEKLGETKEIGIRDAVAQDRVNQTPLPTREVIIAGSGDVLCFDMTTGRYFVSSMEKIRQAENKVNYDIINHDYASLSAFYDEIGLPPTPYSDTVGWNTINRLEVTFSTVLSPDNRPCIAIDFLSAPFIEYSRLW
jgi:hypothetical protein